MSLSDLITNLFAASPCGRQLERHMQEAQHVVVQDCYGAARAFLIRHLFRTRHTAMLCLFPDSEEARQFYEDLLALLPEGRVVHFTAHGRQMWNEVGPLALTIGQRIHTLKSLLDGDPVVVVTSAAALLEKTIPPQQLRNNRRVLQTGQAYDFSELVEYLVLSGYVRESRVDAPGDLAVRGGLVDLYPYEETNPLRLEFFGDRLESIREFDVETQLSIAQRQTLSLLPLAAAGLHGPYIELSTEIPAYSATLVDYFPENAMQVLFDKTLYNNELENIIADNSVRFETFVQDHNLAHFHYSDFYAGAEEIQKQAQCLQTIEINIFKQETAFPVLSLATLRNSHFAGNLSLLRQEVATQEQLAAAAGQKALIAVLCDSDTQAARMRDLLIQEQFPPEVAVAALNLSEGFQWPEQYCTVYTNREIYGRVRIGKTDKSGRRSMAFADLLKIKEGDFVVHTEYGVGVFQGLKQIAVYGKTRECIQIEYADGDKLYVPLEKMDRVQKYASRDGYVPALNKLGGKEWERLKSRTKARVKETAEQLIKLYAVRKMRPGHAFSTDSIWQKELEASFIYDETLDQLSAIAEIKKDMEKPVPMDRLVCGDVGFGKTEVAVRAAFKALNDGKQVAVLVPTTVLAQQHLATFNERLGKFPVRLAALSRFKTSRQQAELLAEVETGEIDLIIGTHRLLSKDIKFKDLGLLIVDEEQKFGVLHKERLKLLKANVDTLTLSATPIPRTLHMSLMGARDMSLINTPPGNRLAIKTEVCRYDKELIREVMLREAERKGQIFFVHNRVATIHAMAHLLRQLVPELTFGVAHGQMEARELEKVMIAFTESKIQCLVSTMIIESGIDVPNCNTLIVNRADRLGLAQLYQLRGRVGRSNQQAYAYFLVPAVRKLTRTAIKRLQTIQEYSHLGSGYKIAMRDLEIRGAGNIFGAEQSGFVDALGYELYAKIIEEAVQELRQDLHLQPAAQPDQTTTVPDARVEIQSDAFLPPDYVPAAADRVDIYKRLIEARDISALEQLEREILDRFGPLPAPARNLIDYVTVKMLARHNGLEEVGIRNGRIIGRFNPAIIPERELFRPWIGKMVQKACFPFELKQKDKDLMFEVHDLHPGPTLAQLKMFLQSIL